MLLKCTSEKLRLLSQFRVERAESYDRLNVPVEVFVESNCTSPACTREFRACHRLFAPQDIVRTRRGQNNNRSGPNEQERDEQICLKLAATATGSHGCTRSIATLVCDRKVITRQGCARL